MLSLLSLTHAAPVRYIRRTLWDSSPQSFTHWLRTCLSAHLLGTWHYANSVFHSLTEDLSVCSLTSRLWHRLTGSHSISLTYKNHLRLPLSRPGVKQEEEGMTRRARAFDKRLCSESGARLDTQGWRQVVLSKVSTSEIQVRLTWRQEVKTEVSR